MFSLCDEEGMHFDILSLFLIRIEIMLLGLTALSTIGRPLAAIVNISCCIFGSGERLSLGLGDLYSEKY